MTNLIKGLRVRLNDERESITHHFSVTTRDGNKYDGYVTVGFYEDGTPGEVFFRMHKIGSQIQGLLDIIATSISIALQYGAPLDVFVNKFVHTRFEPEGITENPEIPYAKSLPDYIFQWLGQNFCGLASRCEITHSFLDTLDQ